MEIYINVQNMIHLTFNLMVDIDITSIFIINEKTIYRAEKYITLHK